MKGKRRNCCFLHWVQNPDKSPKNLYGMFIVEGSSEANVRVCPYLVYITEILLFGHNLLIWYDKQMIFVSIPRFSGVLNHIKPKPKWSDHCIICKLGPPLLKFYYLAITCLFEMISKWFLCLPLGLQGLWIRLGQSRNDLIIAYSWYAN